MRVAVLTSLYPSPPHPFEGIFAERRWRAMAGRGHELTVIQPLPYSPPLLTRGRRAHLRGTPGLEDRCGITVHRPRYLHVPGLAVFNAGGFVRASTGWVRRLRPEIVVADYAWPAAAALPHLSRSDIPGVICARGSDLRIATENPRLRMRFVRALRSSAGWCGVAEHLVAELDRLAELPGKGRLVPNGVDLELFRIRPSRDIRWELGIPLHASLILVVGHLIPRKDPVLSLETFASIAESLTTPQIVFIGDGPLRDQVHARARELGVAHQITIDGELPPERLAEWYAAADCLLLSSSWEGRPNVVLEALASGLPVLATDSQGSAELLGRFPEMIVASRDPRRLGDSLRNLLAAPPDSALLRDTALPFSWQSSCDALEACLDDAMLGARRS
jgi:teichuronic acid biosynthesis glycosyltransferase TuaC